MKNTRSDAACAGVSSYSSVSFVTARPSVCRKKSRSRSVNPSHSTVRAVHGQPVKAGKLDKAARIAVFELEHRRDRVAVTKPVGHEGEAQRRTYLDSVLGRRRALIGPGLEPA